MADGDAEPTCIEVSPEDSAGSDWLAEEGEGRAMLDALVATEKLESSKIMHEGDNPSWLDCILEMMSVVVVLWTDCSSDYLRSRNHGTGRSSWPNIPDPRYDLARILAVTH